MTVDFEMKKAPASMTVIVRVKITRQWRARKWLAFHIIRLGVRVLGCPADIQEEH